MRQGFKLLSSNPACDYAGPGKPGPYKTFKDGHGVPCPYNLAVPLPLLIAIDDPATGQVVGRKLHGDLIASQDTDKIFAHLAGDVRQNTVLVLQLDAEHGVWQRLNDRGHDFDGILFRIARVAFLLVVFLRSRHKLQFYYLLRTPGMDYIVPRWGAACCAPTKPSPRFGEKSGRRKVAATRTGRLRLWAASKSKVRWR